MVDSDILKSKIYTVSELNQEIRKNLEIVYHDIWLEGEVSNFYFHDKKHMYFDLKDEKSKIKVVMFQNSNKNLIFNIEEGLHIIINGYVSVYEKRGEYQIVALDANPVGKGALILAFEQLKAKLEKKGYFDSVRKKNIPVLPGKIGVVTSVDGAVIRDIILVLEHRFENFHLIVRDVNVQGITSSIEICEAIDDLCEYGVDVIILARGGGSLEDLWAFNTEEVAEKIFNCPIPLISAIGHETDYTISDFVADKRAATPSVAGELVILNKDEAIKNLTIILRRMRSLVNFRINIFRKELVYLLKRRIFIKPETILYRFKQDAYDLHTGLKENMKKIIGTQRDILAGLSRMIDEKNILNKIYNYRILVKNSNERMISYIKNYTNMKKNALKYNLEKIREKNPAAILGRGFALVYRAEEDKNIKSIKEVEINQKIKVLLRDGMLNVKVLDKIYKKLDPGFKNGN
ncbi:MAG: exodeoxyribonuclease VII large subunit [Actinomycetota bacterium]|nr:exodeoxyribonuclease VII large subunit [Actinomycetota bacterium]